MNKTKKMSQLTDSKLDGLINEYFDMLTEFGCSVQNINYCGGKIFDSLIELKTLFKNQKFDYKRINASLNTAHSNMVCLEPEFSKKAESYTCLILKVAKNYDFYKTTPSYSFDIMRNVIRSGKILNSPVKTEQYLANLLLLHIQQTEIIEYPLMNTLKQLENHSEYDLEGLFSINNKIRKKGQYRTESRALRDAIAHVCYIIDEKDSEIQLTFKNQMYGYDFSQEYSLMEFHDLLLKISRLHTLFVNISYIVYLRFLFMEHSRRISKKLE